jgi:hypothetical protein
MGSCPVMTHGIPWNRCVLEANFTTEVDVQGFGGVRRPSDRIFREMAHGYEEDIEPGECLRDLFLRSHIVSAPR